MALKRVIKITTGDVLYNTPLITWLLAKTKNYSHFLQSPSVVLMSRETVPKTWTSPSNRVHWVDKLPDYLGSDTRDVTKSSFLDSGHYLLHHRKSGRPMEEKGAFHRVRRV